MKQVLTEIVVKECKSRLVIRATGQIYITRAGDGVDTGVTLTKDIGLLRSDEEHVAIPIETDQNSQTSGEDREDDTISRSCLLNYRIATAELVKVQANDLNGKFVVTAGKHSGSRTGDWKTEIELTPYTPPPPTVVETVAALAVDTGSGGRKVGDVVNFTGSRHYVSSTGDKGYNARPGPAKITRIVNGAKHPYHLIHTDSSSNVYGWVNEGDFS